MTPPEQSRRDRGKIALVLQFWEGDKEMAMRNALRIASNEPAFRTDVEFIFSHRFDCPFTAADGKVFDQVSQRFKTSVYRCTRRGVGHPSGCNDMWCDWVNRGALGRVSRGEWHDVRAMLTFEADSIPVDREWIDALFLEWEKAEKQEKSIVGCWMDVGIPGIGHVNGNMLVAPNLATRVPGILGCPTNHAWDMYFGRLFEPHWLKSGFITNYYKETGVTEAQIRRPVPGFDRPPSIVHGVKDLSVERYADRILRHNPFY
jgi:hypothetical protein